MPESGRPKCSHDCFNCPYPDCIAPDDDLLTAEEIRRSEHLDKEAYILNCEADYSGEEAHRKRISDAKRRYRQTHKAAEKEYGERYRATHREERREINRRYHEAHKDEINARKRELRALGTPTKRKRKPKPKTTKTTTKGK